MPGLLECAAQSSLMPGSWNPERLLPGRFGLLRHCWMLQKRAKALRRNTPVRLSNPVGAVELLRASEAVSDDLQRLTLYLRLRQLANGGWRVVLQGLMSTLAVQRAEASLSELRRCFQRTDANVLSELGEAPDFADWLPSLPALLHPAPVADNEQELAHNVQMAKLRLEVEVAGEQLSLTLDEIPFYLYHPNSELRQRVFSTLMHRLDVAATPVARAIDLTVARRLEEDARQGQSPLAALAGQGLRPDDCEALLGAVEGRKTIVQHWCQTKAERLGIKMTLADLWAPLGDLRSVSLPETQLLLERVFTDLNLSLGDSVRRLFAQGHIDAEPRAGKVQGFFCLAAPPGVSPFISLSFVDRVSDVFNLGHEIGHALHFEQSARAQHWPTRTPQMVTAELAAYFSELLVTDALIDSCPGDLAVATAVAEQATGIVFRQMMLARFELRVYEQRQRGPLDVDTLSGIWLDETRQLYGAAVETPDEAGLGWVYSSQIPSARLYPVLYCAAYLGACVLAEESVKETFAAQYLELLKAGSRPYANLLDESFGLTLSPSFWQRGLDVVERRVAAALELAEKGSV